MNNISLKDANAMLAMNNLPFMIRGNKREQLMKLQNAAMQLKMISDQTQMIDKSDLYRMNDFLLQDQVDFEDHILK